MSASVRQSKNEMVVCYLCSQQGHRKPECPLKPQRRGHNSCRQCPKRQEKTIQSESEMGKGKLPYLLTIQHGKNAKQSICRPLESRSKTISFPVLFNKSIPASSHGWLVLVGDFDSKCCLWNPGSNAMIELPMLRESYIYNKCVLSKPPTEPDCHILFNSYCSYEQSFCKIGDIEYGHQSLLKEESRLVAITSFKGKIYGVITPGYRFVTVEFVGTAMELRPMLIDGEQPWKAPIIKRNCVVGHYENLIESPSGDELLLVIKDFTHHNYTVIDSSEYRVFRVDINRMECIEVDDIGDYAILIGYYGDGYCCSSVGINTYKRNYIYHTSEYGAYVYAYDLDAKSTTTWLPPDVAKVKLSNSYWFDLEELSC